MAKKRKKTRKELLKEPDEFMTLTGKVIGFVVDNKTQLTYGLGIVLAAVIIISGIRFFSIRAEAKAAAMFSQSLTEYDNLKNQKSPDELYSAVSGGFQNLVQKYGGKDGGKLARLVYANICYDAGRFKEAIELYNDALNDFESHAMIHSQILNNLGYAQEQQKDYAAAVGYFEKISEAPQQILRDEALFSLGRLYGKLGQPEKSKTAYQKIVSDYPDFIYIDMVKEKVAG